MSTTDSLEDLQTDEQRKILDTVAQVRKCGLDSILALPQLVVCGDQSAGKSSVLEALTEIPFPRNDNLCTRFATEIILRRAPKDCLTIKLIPDDQRPASEQAEIRAFEESITDFEELLWIMVLALRTMGIDTASVAAFISLAQNKDVFFRLGWHVLKNRSYEEGKCSLAERNIAENTFFRTSNFKSLSRDSVGIVALRARLSQLLFEHVKQELPKLRQDLEDALVDTKTQIAVLGQRRSTPEDCKAYLSQLSLEIYEISKAAVDGHYEGEYFHRIQGEFKDDLSPISIDRIRAVVQGLNTEFAEYFRKNAHRYHIDVDKAEGLWSFDSISSDGLGHWLGAVPPKRMSKEDTLKWVASVLARTRGRELVGNYNPLLVGELFWAQAAKWKTLAIDHIRHVADQCSIFLKTLLHDKCPKDVETRLWESIIHDALKDWSRLASEELDRIMEDVNGYPMNYHHYYTDTIKSRRQNRQKISLAETVKQASKTTKVISTDGAESSTSATATTVDLDQVVAALSTSSSENMEVFSSEEALDCLLAIYKVSQKTFIANITTQVIERHIVRGLEKIFSPVVVNAMSDTVVEAIASEPLFAKRERAILEERVKKLQDGHEIFRGVMGTRR
ncbi:putative dynamin GTPase [Diplocarpon rosae]|nr:putative dynamin GTPase [Diplocarpon rosae]